jgi:hypothetical protein
MTARGGGERAIEEKQVLLPLRGIRMTAKSRRVRSLLRMTTNSSG